MASKAYVFAEDVVLGFPTAGEYPTSWTPEAPTVSATPVTFEGVWGGLTGCELPDGRGLLMWVQSGGNVNVRCAVQPTPASWLTDSFVDSGDTATIITTSQACSAVCYVIDDEVYATVSEPLQCQIFKADDPADPVAGGWSLHGTLDFGTGTNAPFGAENQVASVPIVTSGGDWSIVQGYSAQYYFGASPTGFPRYSWAHVTSSDDGVTWTRQNGDVNDNLYSDIFECRQTVEDPSGNINFSFGRDVSANATFYATPAVGGTLTSAVGGVELPVAIIRNAADEMYAIDRSDNFRLRINDGVPYTDWTDTGVSWTGGLIGTANTPYKLFVLATSIGRRWWLGVAGWSG